MQNKQRLELADYEAENLARLQKTFARKWEFVFMQAEAQAKWVFTVSQHYYLIAWSSWHSYITFQGLVMLKPMSCIGYPAIVALDN